MSDFLGDLPTWLGVVGAAIAFVIGRNEYASAQRWKRSEFVSAQAKEFFESPKVATALTLIDYDNVRLKPDGSLASRDDVNVPTYDDRLLTDALAYHGDRPGGLETFTGEQMVAREAFDELLTGLERFEHYLQTRLVSLDDVSVYLEYWIARLADPDSRWKPRQFYSALHRFIDKYGYDGVKSLFGRFGYRLLDTLPPPGNASSATRSAP